MDWIHHRLSNFIISVDGERARVQADVVAQMQATEADGVGLLHNGRPLRSGARAQMVGWRITVRRRKCATPSATPARRSRETAPRRACGETLTLSTREADLRHLARWHVDTIFR